MDKNYARNFSTAINFNRIIGKSELRNAER